MRKKDKIKSKQTNKQTSTGNNFIKERSKDDTRDIEPNIRYMGNVKKYSFLFCPEKARFA